MKIKALQLDAKTGEIKEVEIDLPDEAFEAAEQFDIHYQ